jgi:hypothetical protein
MRTVANDDPVVGRESGAARAALHWDIEALSPNLRRYARRLTHDVVALARLNIYCQIQPLTPRCEVFGRNGSTRSPSLSMTIASL